MLAGLIMAGGSGERFWPLSTQEHPKQFLSIFDDKPLVRKAYERLLLLMPSERIFVSVNEKQVKELRHIMPELKPDRIIIEPSRKDTAAAIGYGCLLINKYFEDSTIAVVDSDHIIKDENAFASTLKIAESEAKKGNIVTIGLIPTKAETAYGYIFCPNYKLNIPSISLGFKEKPDLETAKKYFDSKEYLWNSGMLVFKYSVLLEAFKKYSRSHFDVMEMISSSIKKTPGMLLLHSKVSKLFDLFDKISIDYAIMEKANNIVVIPSSFGWNDVGSYSAFDELYPSDSDGNICVKNKFFKIDSHNNILISEDPHAEICLLGVDNMVIVVSKNKTLICKKDRVQDLKTLIEKTHDKEDD